MPVGTPILEASLRLLLTGEPRALWASQSVADLLGFKQEKFLSSAVTLSSRIHPHDADIASLLFSAQAEPRSGSFNIRLRHADGRIRIFKGIYSKQAGPDGELILDLTLQDAKSLYLDSGAITGIATFRATMENAEDYLYFKDRNHVFTGASQTLVTLTAAAQHWTDLLGKTDYDLFPEELADNYYRLEKQVFSGSPLAHEFQETLTRDGKKGWVDNRKYPIRDDNGEIVGLWGIARDITDRKQTEEALRQSETGMATAQAYAHLGSWSLDLSTTTGQWSAEMSRLFHCDPTLPPPAFAEFVELIHPEDQAKFLDRFNHIQQTGGLAGFEYRTHPSRGPVRHLTSTSFVIRDGEGRAVRVEGITQDITDRKLVEEALRTSEGRYRTLVESASEGIFVVDAHRFRFVEVNAATCQMLRRSREELLEMGVPDIVAPDELVRIAPEAARLSLGHATRSDWLFSRKDGSRFLVEVSASQLADGFILAIVHDVTQRRRVENELRQSEASLAAAEARAHLGSWELDLDTMAGNWSVQMSRIFGRDPALGAPAREEHLKLIHPEDRAKILAAFEHFEEATCPINFECRTSPELGPVRHLSATVQVSRNAQGRPVRLEGTVLDVTEHKRVEEALRASEAQYRTLVESASEGIFVANADFRYVEVNAAACQMLGYSREELIGLSIPDVVVAEDAPRVTPETGRLETSRATRSDWQFRRKDGTIFLGEVSANRLPDGRFLALVRDVTERRRVEKELLASEASLAAAEARSHLGSWELDLIAMAGHWSAETSRLYHRDPSLGPLTFEEFLGLVHPEDRSKCQDDFRRILETVDPFEFEYRTDPANGPIRLLSTTAYLICDAQGNAVRMEGTTLDVTESRRAEEALRESEANLRDAQETAGLGRYVLDVVSGAWTSSAELDALFGIDASYPRSVASWMALVHPHDRHLMEACMASSDAGRHEHFDEQYRIFRHSDGELRWVHGISRPVLDAQGRLLKKIGTTQDITRSKLAELALRESEESLRETQRIAGLGSYIFDISTGFWTSSEVMDEVFGLAKSARRSVTEWLEVIHPDHRAMMADYLTEEVIGKGLPFDKEYRFVRQNDRAERWAHGTGKLDFDAQGRPLKMRGAIQDITERKLAQMALLENKELLELFIEHAPVSLSMFDREMRYLATSRRGIDEFHLGGREIVGHSHYEILPWLPEHLKVSHQRAMAGETLRCDEDRLEMPDGRVVWLRWEVRPWRTADGAVGGIILFTEDITAQKMAEQALRESREQIQLFIDHAPAALAMFDREMRYLAVSRRWMDDYGLGDLDIAGACHYDIFPEIPERWKDIHCRGLAGETIRTDEDRFDRADGSVQWLRREVRPWRLADGAVGGIVIFSEDITRSKQADERLRLAATVFTHAREGILITDADGAILDINDAFTQITGYTREEVLGRNPRMLSSGLHGKDFYREMWHDLVHKGQWYGEIWNRKKTGELFAALQTISTLLDAQGNITQFLEIFSDITLLKENERKLQHIAHFDLLTGLPNRVLLGDRMHQAMAQAHRRGQMLAVAYLDLDGFKGVNDSHGHEAGDQLLAALATRMKMALREGDTLARLGGDEFVAVLLDLPDVESCLPELNRLLEAAAMNVPCGDLELRVSASLGVTFYPQADDVDADQLLRQADQAMYQAKLSGRNRYHIFDSSQDRSVRGHHENLEQIRQALAANEFVLYYQPKVNMATGEFLGTEALIRWQHPQRGLLPPGVFLPVIEDHPLAVDLGEWVIETALAQMDTWQAMGLHIAVSVNVGARQLQQADFVDRLRALVAAHPVVDPSSLEIEVLETSALQDMSQVSQAIVDCRKLGVSVALDDFGTGYSSLAYLKRLPANILKIDQSFIRDMLEDSDDLAILEGVLGLALAFRRRVIAEGVETVGQGVMLLQLGCEQAQGFCIARPMPAAEIPSWIAAWRPDPSWVGVSAVGASDWPVLYAGVELRAWIASIESFFKEKLGALPAMDEHQCRFGVWLDTEKSGPRANLPAFQIVQTAHQRLHELAAQVVEGKAQGRMAEEITILDLLHSLRDQILEQLTAFMAGS